MAGLSFDDVLAREISRGGAPTPVAPVPEPNGAGVDYLHASLRVPRPRPRPRPTGRPWSPRQRIALALLRRVGAELDESSSDEVVKAAWRGLARSTHPDHNPGDPLASRRFRAVHDAWRLLERGPEGR